MSSPNLTDAGESPSAQAAAPLTEQDPFKLAAELKILAEKVYALLKQELRVERERQGQNQLGSVHNR